MNILLLSASPVMSNLIKNVLSTDNITVSSNSNGEVSSLINLIMVDESLFVPTICQKNIPVVLLSSGNLESINEEAKILGTNVLMKPFTRDQLIETVNQIQ